MGWTKESGCPGCSGALAPTGEDAHVWCCKGCGGLVAHGIEKAHAERLVRNRFHSDAGDPKVEERSTYYDLTYIDLDGSAHRRHGWYDPVTRLILQTG